MKKNLRKRLIFLALPIALLVGCGNDRPTLDDRIGDSQPTSYEGIVESLEALDVYQGGAHKLVTDSGVVIIQSPRIDLNKYLDEEVLVKGEMVKGIGDAIDIFSVEEISYTDESKQVELNAYENTLFGFRFSYPNKWNLDEGSSDLGLRDGKREIVSMAVFTDKTDMDALAASREEGEPTEVTIGAQRALRYMDKEAMGFYVPNPPKKKVYLIKYYGQGEDELAYFYDLLKSFELMYLAQVSGDKCGGLKQIECPEDQICQMESEGKYAEGICVPIGGENTQTSCPYIAPPTGCDHYRISEYSQRGCPSRYECVAGTSLDAVASFPDLNTVDAGEMPQDYEPSNEKDMEDEGIEEFESDEVEEDVGMQDREEAPEAEYEVPDAADVTMLYSNDRAGFSLLMPRTWYYASFGSVGGVWTVGFADFGLEEPEEAIITLQLLEQQGGKAFKEVDGIYYVFDGPSDLKGVMEKMAASVEDLE